MMDLRTLSKINSARDGLRYYMRELVDLQALHPTVPEFTTAIDGIMDATEALTPLLPKRHVDKVAIDKEIAELDAETERLKQLKRI